jgi:IS1 family transposase/transposase-like protein
MARTKKPIHQMTISQWEKAFPNEDTCCAYLVSKRWPEGVKCPRCGADVSHAVSTMPNKWQCYACAPDSGYRFSHLTGTIFENTNKPLRDWFRVIHMMLTSKKGVSSLQVQRVMGFGSYETALYMCNRVRAGLANEDFKKLIGIVEVDETFVGGKAKNRHKDKRGGGNGTGGVGSGKSVIVGAVRRKGNVVARVVNNVRAETLEKFIRESVSTKVSLLCTDQWVGYKHLNKDFPHVAVDHSQGDYVVGAVHTNTIEGFWSLVKRSMIGTYHKVSKRYLPLYVAEAQFRYNNRLNADIFGEAIRSC